MITTIPQFALEIPLNLRFNCLDGLQKSKNQLLQESKNQILQHKKEHLISVINLISILVMF